MLSTFSKVGVGALAVPLLFCAPAAHATGDFSISFDGSVFNCSDPSLNGPIDFSITGSGQTSGANTIFVLDFGSNLGSISVPIPTASVDAIAQAVTSAGGSLRVFIGPEPLGPPGCDVEGHLTLEVEGGSPGTVSANAPSNQVTTQAELRSSTTKIASMIGNRISGALGSHSRGLSASNNGLMVSGMSAGSGDALRIGAWAGYSYTDSRNKFVTTAFDSDRHGVLFGLDAMHGDNLLLGVALGLDRTDVKTRFNTGEQGITGITVAPYLGLLLNDWLSVDASVGYGDVQTDQFRTTAGGVRINSDVESSRVFGSLNLTATHAIDKLLLSGRTGLLYASQKDDSFIESNGTVIPQSRSNLGRFLLGGELAYLAGNWEPFAGATYQYDFTRTEAVFAPGVAQPGNDDADVLFAVGLRYFGDKSVSGSIEYNKLIGRRDLDEDTFSANVRWAF